MLPAARATSSRVLAAIASSIARCPVQMQTIGTTRFTVRRAITIVRVDLATGKPGMDVRIMQKGHTFPNAGVIVNVGTTREDNYDNDGIIDSAAKKRMRAIWKSHHNRPSAFLLFHCAY
jgi:hypothetical protein